MLFAKYFYQNSCKSFYSFVYNKTSFTWKFVIEFVFQSMNDCDEHKLWLRNDEHKYEWNDRLSLQCTIMGYNNGK